MIDYFALLDQPHMPWLDLDRLKEVYHRKTLQDHPDLQTNRGDASRSETILANLNEAYQVLRDPKRRVHHLLCLEGREPLSTNRSIPAELHDLFSEISPLTNATRALLEEVRAVSNALSRALLKPRIVELQNRVTAVRDKIQRLEDHSDAELQRLNQARDKLSNEQIDSLSNLYFIYAYLSRWSAQLDEMIFQLSVQ